MKIIKISKSPEKVIINHFSPGESKAWRWATIVIATAALLAALTRCASAPISSDIKTLQEENARLSQLLDECEQDARKCLDLLSECESLSK